MPLGPGKYDAECTELRERLKVDGLILIALHNDGKAGFSAQLTGVMRAALPVLLREVADQIEIENLDEG